MKYIIILILFCLSYSNEALAQNDYLIPYRKDTLWGYCDINGKIKIKPQFKRATIFNNICPYDNSSCYDELSNREFDIDVALVYFTKDSCALIDKQGKIITSASKFKFRTYHNGNYIVFYNQILNRQGKIIAKIDFKGNWDDFYLSESGHHLSGKQNIEPLFSFWYDHDLGFFDKRGKVIIPPCNYCSAVYDDKYVAYDGDKLIGVKNIRNETVLDLKDFSSARMYYDLILMCKKIDNIYSWGVINLKNEVIIPFQYEQLSAEDNYQYFIGKKKSGEYVCIDNKGKERYTFDNYDSYSFRVVNDILYIKEKGKNVIYDRSFNKITDISFNDNSVFKAIYRNKLYYYGSNNSNNIYIDSLGKVLFPSIEYCSYINFNCLEEDSIAIISHSAFINADVKLFNYPNHYIKRFSNNLIQIEDRKTNRKGLVNFRGDTILPPIYYDINILRDTASEYNGYLIICKDYHYWGIADTQGKVILKPCLHTNGYEFNNYDYHFIKPNWCPPNSFGVLDSSLYIWSKQRKLMKINGVFLKANLSSQNDTIILVERVNWKNGLYNTEGKMMLPMEYEYIDLHGNKSLNYCYVQKDTFNAIVDLRSCKEIFTFSKQYSAPIYSNDYAILSGHQDKKETILYDINAKTQVHFPNYISKPANDRVWMHVGDTLVLMDVRGNKIKELHSFRFETDEFHGDITVLSKYTELGERYICIDKNGNKIVQDTLTRVFWGDIDTYPRSFWNDNNRFSTNGKRTDIAFLCKDSLMAVIDYKGKMLINFSNYRIQALAEGYWFLSGKGKQSLLLNSKLDTILKDISILGMKDNCIAYSKDGKYYELGNENNTKQYFCIENSLYKTQLTPYLKEYYFLADHGCGGSSSYGTILTDNNNNIIIPDTSNVSYEYIPEGNVVFATHRETHKSALLDTKGKTLIPFLYIFNDHKEDFKPWGFEVIIPIEGCKHCYKRCYVGFDGIKYFEDTPPKNKKQVRFYRKYK